MLVVGAVVALVVAYMSMKRFVDYLKKKKLTVFGIYRIVVGIIALVA